MKARFFLMALFVAACSLSGMENERVHDHELNDDSDKKILTSSLGKTLLGRGGPGLHYLALTPHCYLSLLKHASIIGIIEFSAEPTDEAYCEAKHDCRVLITHLADAYLIILPKLLGCVMCQFAHEVVRSERYAHYLMRREQLIQLKEKITHIDYNPRAILFFIENTMCPFHGDFGEDFYQQCKLALDALIAMWDQPNTARLIKSGTS